jgi:hypothetical protein
MPRITGSEPTKLIRERLSAASTEYRYHPIGRQPAWQFKRRIARELREVGRSLDLTDSDISNRSRDGFGCDIIFSSCTWATYGHLWIGRLESPTPIDVERTFREHEKRSIGDQCGLRKTPIRVHHCYFQSTKGTLRRTHDVDLFGCAPPRAAQSRNELVSAEWTTILEGLSRRFEDRGIETRMVSQSQESLHVGTQP